jgi:outer membrane lipoprotein carrier protein
MRYLFLTVFILLSTAVHASDAKTQLVSFLTELTSLTADFQQRVLDENGHLVETSRGTLKVLRPGRFRWSYTEPYPQEIIGNEQRVWIYDSELEQVSVKAMDEALGNSPALLLSSDRPLEEAFEVVNMGERNAIDWVELKPRNEDPSFAAFRVGMTNGSLRIMELHDNFGQRTQLSFGNITRNPSLAADVFTFQPPPGADVVGEVPGTAKSETDPSEANQANSDQTQTDQPKTE